MARSELFDRVRLGQRMKSARVDAGFSTAEEFVRYVARQTGYAWGAGSEYKYEGGERLPSEETLRAIQIALELPKSYWDVALHPAYRERWERLQP